MLQAPRFLLLLALLMFNFSALSTSNTAVAIVEEGSLVKRTGKLTELASLNRYFSGAYGDRWDPERSCLKVEGPGARESFEDSEACIAVLIAEAWRGRVLVVLAGNAIDKDGTPRECHSCPGVLQIVELARGDQTSYRELAKSPLLFHGAWGKPRENFSFVSLDVNETWLLGVDDGGTYQGNTVARLYVYAPVGGEIREVFQIETLDSLQRNCDDRDEDQSCEDETNASVYLEDGNTKEYPRLRVIEKEKSTRGNLLLKSLRRIRIFEFDNLKRRYVELRLKPR